MYMYVCVYMYKRKIISHVFTYQLQVLDKAQIGRNNCLHSCISKLSVSMFYAIVGLLEDLQLLEVYRPSYTSS